MFAGFAATFEDKLCVCVCETLGRHEVSKSFDI